MIQTNTAQPMASSENSSQSAFQLDYPTKQSTACYHVLYAETMSNRWKVLNDTKATDPW